MLTASELLDWLGKNLFLPAAQVDELRPLLSTFADGHALGKELIRRNWLSPYQVNQILQGQGESLIVGANRLLERIGEGAMGQVFKAWNTRLGRMVAVKMVHKEYVDNAKAMGRFEREIQTASQLDHPNIVLVRDAGNADGRPFLVMDFITGINLWQHVKQRGPLPTAEAVGYARQAALGLQHAHERGVVHRDIKPGNLMLVRNEAPTAADVGDQVKILDFGLSRFDSETRNAGRLTHAGNIIGTVDYIAPEQAQDARTADIRADLYSLGCTLYYLLTGKPPFPGESVVEKVTARTSGDPPSVRAVRADIPAGLDAVLQRLMARQPDQRYASPKEAAQALLPFTKVVTGDAATATLNQADLATALAARRAPIAMPMTQPAPVGVAGAAAVAMAQPLPPDGVPVVQAVPVAVPPEFDAPPLVQAIPVPVAEGHELFAQPRGAARTSSAIPVAMPIPMRRRRRLLIGGSAVAILAMVAVLAIVYSRGPGTSVSNTRAYGAGAALAIMPMTPMTIKEGKKIPVIVQIQRKDFTGPVRVFFEQLPSGFRSEEVTFSPKQDMNQLYLMVSFGTGADKAELRLVAVAENLRASIPLPVTIEPVRKQLSDDDGR